MSIGQVQVKLGVYCSWGRGAPKFDTKYGEAPQRQVVLSVEWGAPESTTYNKYYLSQKGHFNKLIFHFEVSMVSQDVFG